MSRDFSYLIALYETFVNYWLYVQLKALLCLAARKKPRGVFMGFAR
jgi:hypothetical protein